MPYSDHPHVQLHDNGDATVVDYTGDWGADFHIQHRGNGLDGFYIRHGSNVVHMGRNDTRVRLFDTRDEAIRFVLAEYRL